MTSGGHKFIFYLSAVTRATNPTFYRADRTRSRNTADTSGSGAGLGLSIVQWLAQVHGGHIEVNSQVGQGSAFTVWLPLEASSVTK